MKNNNYNKRFELIENELQYLKVQNDELIKKMDFIKYLILFSSNNESSNMINFCPVCGEFSEFLPFGIIPRDHAQCPHCRSLERHRFTFLLFKRYENLLNKNISLLHFAPEPIFYKYFDNKMNIDYFPVDFNPTQYESTNIKICQKVNMEDIPYDDYRFDIIYNSHVLEHVPDDIKAMKELYRVLKKEGICIISVPMSKSPKTLEEPQYNSPELREKYYGQEDHLRRYGLDFKERLESVGFKVDEIKPIDVVDNILEKKLYGLSNSSIFVCTK